MFQPQLVSSLVYSLLFSMEISSHQLRALLCFVCDPERRVSAEG